MLSAPLYGNSASESDDNKEKSNISIDFWTAYSPQSSSFFAKMENTRRSLLGIGIRHTNLEISGQILNFASEITLFGRTRYPVNGVDGPQDQRSGIGLVPIRLTVPFTGRSEFNYPFFDTGFGFLLFEDHFPNNDGTLLNVTIDTSIGYNFRISENSSLAVGYRFHHLSNAGTGKVNPGIDSNMLVISFRSLM
jgi:hypothetical protein